MLTSKLMDFIRDEEGASAIEYALIAAMVAVVVVGFVPDIRNSVTNIFVTINNGLTTASK